MRFVGVDQISFKYLNSACGLRFGGEREEREVIKETLTRLMYAGNAAFD